MKNLAIKGHETRGKEVIEILKMFGGSNLYDYSADNDGLCFYINKGTNIIDYDLVNNCYEDEDTFIFTLEGFLEVFPYRVGDKVQHKGATSCGTVYVIERMKWANNHTEYEIRPLYDYNHTGLVTLCVESLQPYKEETMEEEKKYYDEWLLTDYLEFEDNDAAWADEVEVNLGKDYEIQIRGDKTFIVKKKSQYPKTYEECCNILQLEHTFKLKDLTIDEEKLTLSFIRLKRCRDAYWKIAGKQMGLGKPWEPDSKNIVHYIYYSMYDNEIQVSCGNLFDNEILAFPTAEMRDGFYENFKDLIEACKEFL